ncbi:MAG: hypothetical protein Q8P67_24180 [archaeon]|nr:hypothetical protein [archaeon]
MKPLSLRLGADCKLRRCSMMHPHPWLPEPRWLRLQLSEEKPLRWRRRLWPEDLRWQHHPSPPS